MDFHKLDKSTGFREMVRVFFTHCIVKPIRKGLADGNPTQTNRRDPG